MFDPSLKTADNLELWYRNKNPTTDIHISFPTKMYSGNNVTLPAYIKSLKDSFSPKFGTSEPYGRMDPIPSFQNTTRTVSLSVGIPAFDEFDAVEHQKKVNILCKNAYPGYVESGKQKIMSTPPLIRVRFANLLVSSANNGLGLLGFLTSPIEIDYQIDEYGVFVVEGLSQKIFPKFISISLSFTVLHEHEVGWFGTKFMTGSENYEDFPTNIGKIDLPKSISSGSIVANAIASKIFGA